MKTVLLLTDFSTGGNHAAAYGYHLAKHLKANVVICNAIVIPLQMAEAGVIGWPVNGYDGIMEDTEKELKKLKKVFEHSDHSSGFHPQIDCMSQMGRLGDVVENISSVLDVVLIVMGTHHDGFGSLLLDNNTRNMINTTNHPLVLVPPHAQFKDIKKMSFATDFEFPLQDAEDLERLVPMARLFGAEIVITHVHSPERQLKDHQVLGNELVAGVFNKTNYSEVVYQAIQNDHPNWGISHFCAEAKVDLLVMVHRSHNFMDVMLKGSHTQKMARDLPIPMFVIPAGTKNHS